MTQSRIRSWTRGLAAIFAVLLLLGGTFLAVRGWNNIHVVIKRQGRQCYILPLKLYDHNPST